MSNKNKFLNWLSNVGQRWAMSSDPAVMQASGYISKPEGVKHEDSESAQQLRDNLSVISGAANTITNVGLLGFWPTVASEATAIGGGKVGEKIGEKVDEKLGTTHWTPVTRVAGSIVGASLPFAAQRGWNSFKSIWNSGRTTRPVYDNWGGEFIDNKSVRSITPGGVATNKIERLLTQPRRDFTGGLTPRYKESWFSSSTPKAINTELIAPLRAQLIKEGVDPNLLTNTNLTKLVELRKNGLLNAPNQPSRFVLWETSGPPDVDNVFHLYRPSKRYPQEIGYMYLNNDGEIAWVAKHPTLNKTTNPVYQAVSEDLYNAGIENVGKVISGRSLESAERTIPVVERFNKKKVGRNGRHLYYADQPDEMYFERQPVYQLLEPTRHVPTKYSNIFSTEALDNNGNWVIDFNKGLLYKNGGAIQNNTEV